MASSLREFLIRKELLTSELNSAIIEYDTLQLMKLQEEKFPFGKYKGEPIDDVLKRTSYCKWLFNETKIFEDGRFADIKQAIMDKLE